MDHYLHELEGANRDALIETLKRINWVAGYGDVTMIEQRSQMARIERTGMSPTLRRYTLMKDWKDRLVVRFCGRTRIIKP